MNNEILKAVADPRFYHVGLLSKDAQASVEQLRIAFPNLSNVDVVEIYSNHDDLLVGKDFHLICATCRVGRIAFEFVQPVGCPDSYQSKALAEHGEGFHHVAFVYSKEEFPLIVEGMLANGYEIVFASKMGGGVRNCYYLAPKNAPGMVIELLDGTSKPIDY